MNAIISVSDKTNLDKLCNFLNTKNYNLYCSGGTYKYLEKENIQNIYKIEDLVQQKELLGGRVKTLHPHIHAGILCDRENEEHMKDIKENNIKLIDLIVVNLYPFKKVLEENRSEDELIENIDIGGHTLIRAGCKNHKYVSVLTNSNDYEYFVENYDNLNKKELSRNGFDFISKYDMDIANKYSYDNYYKVYKRELKLRYGCNPYQDIAFSCSINDKFPIKILNGKPGYINLLDAFNSWQLVKEINEITNKITATSFKHTAPAGLSVCNELTTLLKYAYNNHNNLSNTALAYLRARNSDPLSSFGDFIAISDKVDVDTAILIKREVSDGIIAPDYDNDALKILKSKKKGNYLIIQVDKEYELNENIEIKEIFGVGLIQNRNNYIIDDNTIYNNIVTLNDKLENNIIEDLKIAYQSLKYIPSNSVAFVYDGQVVSVGCGQQNRVDCVRIAGKKARKWLLRQHPKVLDLNNYFKQGISRQEKINCIMNFIDNEFTSKSYLDWEKNFVEEFTYNPLTNYEINEYCKLFNNFILASDGFFPFRDNIDECYKYGVKYIIQPGGSIQDINIIDTCNKYGILMVNTNNRMFYH